ncbi:hypothetical protein BpHYR1_019437 [Brachionus plicatilis]|uniref:Uncharacterized protein n=1 Tax=Brachionus plicatilis TaxID=10195 RepID=A0A3M7PET1_BRAPC|nr:hypothetical protein BpHYR1_019437 [Brachionus plicatilis]
MITFFAFVILNKIKIYEIFMNIVKEYKTYKLAMNCRSKKTINYIMVHLEVDDQFKKIIFR